MAFLPTQAPSTIARNRCQSLGRHHLVLHREVLTQHVINCRASSVMGDVGVTRSLCRNNMRMVVVAFGSLAQGGRPGEILREALSKTCCQGFLLPIAAPSGNSLERAPSNWPIYLLEEANGSTRDLVKGRCQLSTKPRNSTTLDEVLGFGQSAHSAERVFPGRVVTTGTNRGNPNNQPGRRSHAPPRNELALTAHSLGVAFSFLLSKVPSGQPRPRLPILRCVGRDRMMDGQKRKRQILPCNDHLMLRGDV